MDQADRVVITRGDEVVVGLARIPPDRVVITYGGEIVVFDDGEMAIVRGDEACVDFTQLPHVDALIVPDVWDLVTMLIRLLHKQSAIAELTLPSAQDDIAVNRKRMVGTVDRRQAIHKTQSRKSRRSRRNCLAKREDATKHFAVMGGDIRLHRPPLRNIWKDVQKADTQKGNR